MKLNERAIRKTIAEAISDYMKYGCVFGFDTITEMTLRGDEHIVNEAEENYNWILRRKNWEINNYGRFIDIINKTPKELKGFLTYHGMDEITQDEWITYTLKGYDVAFALHYIEPGKIDICNLVNNSELKGISRYVFQFAKQEGGTQMDNYRGNDGDPGKLGKLYRSLGFNRQTWFDNFNPEFQPDDPEWRLDTEKWGTPDVEGLELGKHRMKYNDPHRRYKEKFDRRIGRKFKK